MFVKNGTGELKKVLVSRPTYLKPAPINEIAKRWKDTALNIMKMEEEHQMLVQAYLTNGVEVEYLEPKASRPNAVFARDFGACVREGYILGKFKLDMRKEEHIDYQARMLELEVPIAASCTEGLFEGGDFMFLDEKHILIGMADRSNQRGVEEIREQLQPYGYEVTGASLEPKYLHLDMCFNLVDDHLAVTYWDGMPPEIKKLVRKLDIDIIPISEESIYEHGCNLQSLGKHRVLSLKKNRGVNDILASKGMEVIELDITEILKAGGGPHCMTFPLIRS